MLKKFWHAWMRFGHWMGDNVTRALLVIFYFTVALPFALIVRLAQDPLDVKRKDGAGWLQRETKEKAIKDARRAF